MLYFKFLHIKFVKKAPSLYLISLGIDAIVLSSMYKCCYMFLLADS